jgi:sugar lactone lactonase YvrE
MKHTPEVRIAVPARSRVGEGPVWDDRAGRLHWVDILAGQVHTSEPDTASTETITVPTLVGAAVPRLGGGFVAATTEGFAEIDAAGHLRTRAAILPAGSRMNDAKCDPTGRFWAGSTDMEFANGQGALHVLDTEWSTRLVLDGLTLPNGLDWSPDGRTFYLVDTMERHILAFDVDLTASTLSHRRVLTAFSDSGGLPDGMCVDADGCLWVAMWGGDRILRLSPDGDRLGDYALPVHQPSSCAFGGPRRDVLFVTSASEGLPDNGAPDGAVLTVTGLGARGLPTTCFAG